MIVKLSNMQSSCTIDRNKESARRALIISYVFPPVGGAGVQRVTKFVKYLPQFGWQCSVLTCVNPSVPVFDERLCADIPDSTLVVKSPTWEPSYAAKRAVADDSRQQSARQRITACAKRFARRTANVFLQPDPQVLWNVTAYSAAKKLLNRISHDVIVATGPPFSTFVVAARISKAAGLPLILDYRDEWGISNAYWENKRIGRASQLLQQRQQRTVLAQASVVIATSEQSALSLSNLAQREQSPIPAMCIYNGYDPDDFSGHTVASTASTIHEFRLVYVGTLWSLTTAEPLVRALKQFGSLHGELSKRLTVVFAGRRTPDEDRLLQRLNNVCKVERLEYVDHPRAVQLMYEASALCVLLADVPGAGRVMPAKLFEYMATGRPVLAIAPAGELQQLVQGYPYGSWHAPSDTNGVVGRLAALMYYPEVRQISGSPDYVTRFSRPNQARELAAVLDSVATPRSTFKD